jgi:surfeit locus 1 family protein
VNDAPASRAGLVAPALVALAALLVFVGLGTWQIQRKAWKEGLIDTLERRLAAAPSALPPREQWTKLNAADDEFRRVKFSATFVPRAQALVYASASALRSDVSGQGYWIFAPARTSAGALVIVNRGFVPDGRQDPATRAAGEIAGPIELVGVMRWPEPHGTFSPADEPARNLWFVRDHVAIATAKGWDRGLDEGSGRGSSQGSSQGSGQIAPFFVEQEAPEPPGGLPHPGALKVNLRNEHLQYAITWYGLAVVVVVMFAVWLGSWRHAKPDG